MVPKGFIFSDSDLAAVLHYMHYGNMTQAYEFSRFGQFKGSRQSLNTMAGRFFNTEKIKALLVIESQKLESNIDVMYDRLGLKKPEPNIKPKEDNQTELSDINLTREGLIALIARKLTGNPDDATVKTLSPLIAKLESWDTQKPQDNSNIVIYELPSKAN